MNKYNIGDSCLCWSIGDVVDPAISAKILYAYRKLKMENILYDTGILDVVPSYKALAVHYNPLGVDLSGLTERVERALCESLEMSENACKGSINMSEKKVIPVVYNGDDLHRISEIHGMKKREVIDLHKSGEYTVAMVGFKPHFPYLTGLSKRLDTPRLSSPRIKIPAGAVAIGGAQAGIYPEESPGGWNLLGITDPSLLKTIEPGDRIEFVEVDFL